MIKHATGTNDSQPVQIGYLKNVQNRVLMGASLVCTKENSPMCDSTLTIHRNLFWYLMHF